MITRRRALFAALLPFAAEAAPMQVSHGAPAFDAVRITDPIDPAAISAALLGWSVQVVGGAVEVGSQAGRCFARPGQWVVLDRATGTARAVDAPAFNRFEKKTDAC